MLDKMVLLDVMFMLDMMAGFLYWLAGWVWLLRWLDNVAMLSGSLCLLFWLDVHA